MRARTKVLITAAVAVPLVLAGAGTAYATHYQDRALPGSTLGGVSVAGLTRDQVAAARRSSAPPTSPSPSTPARPRAPRTWPTSATRSTSSPPSTRSSPRTPPGRPTPARWSPRATSTPCCAPTPRRPTKVVADLVATAGKAGTDASVMLAPDKKSFVVVPAVPGKSVTTASFHDVVTAAGHDLSSATTTLQFVDAMPTVTTARAEQVADQANALVKRTVKVIDGKDDHAASRKTKATWVTLHRARRRAHRPHRRRRQGQGLGREGGQGGRGRGPTSGVRNVDSSGAVKQVVEPAHDGAVMTNAAEVRHRRHHGASSGKDYKGSFDSARIPATWTERRDRRRCRAARLPRRRGREVGRRQPAAGTR